MHDKTSRTFLKTISWRVVATMTTMTIVFSFTKELSLSFGIGAIEVFSKMLLYYFHERVWNKVSWGRGLVPSSVISENTNNSDHN
jgi:uncharacterized membrane protein